MFGQYNNLQTCDELEIRRLLWGAGVRPELSGTTAFTTNTITAHSQQQQQPQTTNFQIAAATRSNSDTQRSSSTMPSRGGNHHHQHHQQRQLQAPTGHLTPQYNTAPSPAHTHASIVPTFSQNQRLAFIPQHLFPTQDMMPYNLGNKPLLVQHQQQNIPIQTTPSSTSSSVIRTPQGNQRGRNSVTSSEPMPSMPNLNNLFSSNPLYSHNFTGAVFQQQQQQQRDETPEREDPNEDDPPANGEDSEDDDYECEEEEEDEDEIIEEVTGPYNCGFCQKYYKRKSSYLNHLKHAHNKSSMTPPSSSSSKQGRRSSSGSPRKTFTALLPPQRQQQQQQQQQHTSQQQQNTHHLRLDHDPNTGNMYVSRREERRNESTEVESQDEESQEFINAAKDADGCFQCAKCRKKFKTERNFRKHLQNHREMEQQQRNSGQVPQHELQRAIAGIMESPQQAHVQVPTHPHMTVGGITHPHSQPIAPDNYIAGPQLQLFKCQFCPEFLDDKEKLKNHEINQHKSCVCVDCGELVAEAKFPEHKKRHLIEPPVWKCAKCQTSFDIYKKFKEHLQSAHLAEPYKEPSIEFLTRKVPPLPPPAPPKEEKPAVTDKPSIPSLNQVEMKRAVELYTGDKRIAPGSTEEATRMQVVHRAQSSSNSRTPNTANTSRSRPSNSKSTPARKTPARRTVIKISSDSDTDPEFIPSSENSIAKKRPRRSTATAFSFAAFDQEVDVDADAPVRKPMEEPTEDEIELIDLDKEDEERDENKNGNANGDGDIEVVEVQPNKVATKAAALAAYKPRPKAKPKTSRQKQRKSGKVIYSDSDSNVSTPTAYTPDDSQEPGPSWRATATTTTRKRGRKQTLPLTATPSPSVSGGPSTPVGMDDFSAADEDVEFMDVDVEDENSGQANVKSIEGNEGIDPEHPTYNEDNECDVCHSCFDSNADLTTHILNEHCWECEVRLLSLQKELEKLGEFEILDDDEDDGNS